MARDWNNDELEASVRAYLEMRNNEIQKIHYTKKSYYQKLAIKFDRSEKAFEYRMQNISYVLSLMGRNWIKGLKPAANVGTNVAIQIEKIINEIENSNSNGLASFQLDVKKQLRLGKTKLPDGKKKPTSIKIISKQYSRDPSVAAWVLKLAKGKCECCGVDAPFKREDHSPFLEVHHVRHLADGGSDTVTNTVAVCPNCHRELHYGHRKFELVGELYNNIRRLVEE